MWSGWGLLLLVIGGDAITISNSISNFSERSKLMSLLEQLEQEIAFEEIEASAVTGKALMTAIKHLEEHTVPADAQQKEIMTSIQSAYRTLKRLRRYLYVCPKNTARGDDFHFMTGNNVARAAKLGIYLALLGTASLIDGDHAARATNASALVITTEPVGHLATRAITTTAKAVGNVDVFFGTVDKLLAKSKGKFAPPLGFDEMSFSEYYEGYLKFMTFRDALGNWDEKQMDESLKAGAEQGEFKAAAQIEAFMNNKYVIAVDIVYGVTTLVLCIVFFPVGAVMGVIGAIWAAIKFISDAAAGNIRSMKTLTLIMLMLRTFYEWEKHVLTAAHPQSDRPDQCVQPAPGELGASCNLLNYYRVDPLEGSHGCNHGLVCVRELVFPIRNLLSDLDFEFEPSGVCGVRRVGHENPLGARCELHDDCASGYCHFDLPDHPLSLQLWSELFVKKTLGVDIPDYLRYSLLDFGTCTQPYPAPGSDGSYYDLSITCEPVLDTPRYPAPISSRHQFWACLTESARDSAHGMELPRLRSRPVKELIQYAHPITIYAREKHDDEVHWIYWFVKNQRNPWTVAITSYEFIHLHTSPESLSPAWVEREKRSEELGPPVDPINLSLTPWLIASQGTLFHLCGRGATYNICAKPTGTVDVGDIVVIAFPEYNSKLDEDRLKLAVDGAEMNDPARLGFGKIMLLRDDGSRPDFVEHDMRYRIPVKYAWKVGNHMSFDSGEPIYKHEEIQFQSVQSNRILSHALLKSESAQETWNPADASSHPHSDFRFRIGGAYWNGVYSTKESEITFELPH